MRRIILWTRPIAPNATSVPRYERSCTPAAGCMHPTSRERRSRPSGPACDLGAVRRLAVGTTVCVRAHGGPATVGRRALCGDVAGAHLAAAITARSAHV